MPGSKVILVAEFKNYRIGGDEMDKLIGTAMRVRFRGRPASLSDVILFCRGFTREAQSRAQELEQELNIRISFKVVP